MKEASRGTAALACLPSKEGLNSAYQDLLGRIDQIVAQAQAQGSLTVAISGLNSIRHTLDSLMRLGGHDRPIGTQVNVAVQNNLAIDVRMLAERLSATFDQEPELRARIARALIEMETGEAAGAGRAAGEFERGHAAWEIARGPAAVTMTIEHGHAALGTENARVGAEIANENVAVNRQTVRENDYGRAA